MACSKTRVDIPTKLIATIVVAFILAWLVTADETDAHASRVPMVCSNGTVHGIDGHERYRCFHFGNAYSDTEKKCEESTEVRGSTQLVESKAKKKIVKGIQSRQVCAYMPAFQRSLKY